MQTDPRRVLSIRLAVPGDEERIARLVEASWRASLRSILSRDLLDSRAWQVCTPDWAQRIRLADQGSLVVLATIDLRLVGVAAGRRFEHPVLDRRAVLGELFVAPEFQRRGVGSKLLANLAWTASQAGAVAMKTRCLARNEGGRAFLERSGAREGRHCHETLRSERVEHVRYAWPTLAALVSGRE